MFAAAFNRWGWRGPALITALLLVGNVVQGTLAWRVPHQDPAAVGSRGQDWACHSANAIPSVLLLGVTITLTLYLRRRTTVGIRTQFGEAFGAMTLAFGPAFYVLLWGVIDVLRCDTL
jgi:hypothetical protein